MTDIPIIGGRDGRRRMLAVRVPEPVSGRFTLTATVPHRGGFVVVHVTLGDGILDVCGGLGGMIAKDREVMDEIRLAVSRGRARA